MCRTRRGPSWAPHRRLLSAIREVKGILTELEFAKFVQLLRDYAPAIRTDVAARLCETPSTEKTL